ncbi:MAG: prepilin-type N-terminal cleavage/methylation domain-containing protein [Candidatus Liptonbacteria bacterium]|nr:prepilin-type N-terminal cleavage/methylation domain-containing protein [Candidatus Liptonbacteria bacterium]
MKHIKSGAGFIQTPERERVPTTPPLSVSRLVSGFTMIEIVMVVAIVAFLAGLGLWVGMDVYRSYSYRSERSTFVSALQKARLESMVNINEVKHGVHIEPNEYVIFQGSAYVSADPFNQVIIPSGAVTLAGNPALPRDVVFDQLSGVTASVGTLTISDGVRSTVISINNEGQISW